MRDKKVSPAARISAAAAILDRAYGRPSQQVDLNTEDRKLADMSDAELLAFLEQTRDDVAALAQVQPKR